MATLVLDFRDFQARSNLQLGSRMRASTETIEKWATPPPSKNKMTPKCIKDSAKSF